MLHCSMNSHSHNVISSARNRQAATVAAAAGWFRQKLAGSPGVPLVILAVAMYSAALAWFSVGSDNVFIILSVFAAAAVSSIAGFAFSAVCGGILFHLHLGQIAVVQIMTVCSIAIQAYTVTSLRHSIPWRTVGRFVGGGVVGLPIGLLILLHASRTAFVHMTGVLVCFYSLYMLLRRPVVLPSWARRYDALIGLIGGVTGGAIALPGAPVTVWAQMFGWNRDEQRGIYQPFILLMQLLSLACMTGLGAVPAGSATWMTAALAVPPALAGAAIGLGWFRQFSDRQFRLAVNLLLLTSGLGLIA